MLSAVNLPLPSSEPELNPYSVCANASSNLTKMVGKVSSVVSLFKKLEADGKLDLTKPDHIEVRFSKGANAGKVLKIAELSKMCTGIALQVANLLSQYYTSLSQELIKPATDRDARITKLADSCEDAINKSLEALVYFCKFEGTPLLPTSGSDELKILRGTVSAFREAMAISNPSEFVTVPLQATQAAVPAPA